MENEDNRFTRNRYAIIHAIGGTRFIANRFTAKLISINAKKFTKNNYYSIKMSKNQAPKPSNSQPGAPNANLNGNKAANNSVSKGNHSNVAKGGQPNDLHNSRNYKETSQNSFDAGGKVVARKLWWHESESEKKVNLNSLPKFNVTPKVDHQSDWSPSKSRKAIETRKLDWKAQPVLNTRENINYVPGGGKKRYPTEQLEWNATHKVDSGFLYEFE